jgi:hypothetical protein
VFTRRRHFAHGITARSRPDAADVDGRDTELPPLSGLDEFGIRP